MKKYVLLLLLAWMIYVPNEIGTGFPPIVYETKNLHMVNGCVSFTQDGKQYLICGDFTAVKENK